MCCIIDINSTKICNTPLNVIPPSSQNWDSIQQNRKYFILIETIFQNSRFSIHHFKIMIFWWSECFLADFLLHNCFYKGWPELRNLPVYVNKVCVVDLYILYQINGNLPFFYKNKMNIKQTQNYIPTFFS